MKSLIPSSWDVPPVFRARLGESAGRQRCMAANGQLLLVLHKVPRPGQHGREHVLFWRNANAEWRSTESGSGLAALQTHFDDWRQVTDGVEKQMEAHSAGSFFAILQHTSPLLRAIRNTHRTLQEARATVPEDRAILLARDDAGELERALELLHHEAQNGLEYMIAKQGEANAERANQLVATGHRLNLIIALFLPLTALGSIFGMNLITGLENWQSPWLFWTLLAGALMLGAALMAAIRFSNPNPQPPVQASPQQAGRQPLAPEDLTM
jgi:hypothetical protein